MKIVAFLQNPWFPDHVAERHKKLYGTDVNFRRRVLARSMSGRRLITAFGYDLYESIWWDNANPECTSHAAGLNKADWDHIARVVAEQKPKLVLTFGNQARDGFTRAQLICPTTYEIETLHCHHPNARHKTQADLNNFADIVRRVILTHDGKL